MHDHEVRETLAASLQDGQLDRTERDSFRAWLEKAAPDSQKRGVYQSMAFALVAESLEKNSVPPHSALNWLERIVKLLTPIASNAPAALAEACFSPQHDCVGRIVRLFDQTRRSVDACVFTITDNDKSFDPGSDIERLARAGVPVRQDETEFHMHHKFALFDGEVLLTGSFNWTRSANEENHENALFTDDAALVRLYQAEFERCWKLGIPY